MRDALRGPLRSAAAAAFIVGTLLFLLNPPSLSGAERLISILLGAVALLIRDRTGERGPGRRRPVGGRDRADHRAQRAPGRRSRRPEQPPTEFDALVEDAIDALPAEFRELLADTPVVISHLGREHRAYGHYIGDTVARENYPDRIVIYRDTLERDFGHDPDLLRAQVERTLRHEVAHHLGWGEKGVQNLGL
ncbi:MAG: metallopeptidase family protein [Thermoleophilaceae bacterium]